MNGQKQDRLMGVIVLGVCLMIFGRAVNLFEHQDPPTNKPTSKPDSLPVLTSISGMNAVAAQAYGKSAWDCGAIQSIRRQPNFNSDCATKAWRRNKPFRLQLGMYYPNWGGYNGVLLGDNNRHLFLSLKFSSVNGIWRIEKEVKNAFIATQNGKDVLFWRDQKQDLGVTYPRNFAQ